jgi:hypothetical protein
VTITLSSDRPLGVRGVGTKYVPPDGTLFLTVGGRTGYLEVDGLTVSIEATSEELVLSAARALEPMPR